MTAGTQTHEARAVVRPWRGTPAQFARVVHRAGDALRERMRADSMSSVNAHIEVSYGDSRTTFDDVEAFVDAARSLPAHRIDRIAAHLGSPASTEIRISATQSDGVMVVSESTDEIFAQGIRVVLAQLLYEDKVPPRYTAGAAPVGMKIVLALGILTGAGSLIWALWGQTTYDVEEWLWPGVLLLVGGPLFFALLVRGEAPERPLTFLSRDEPARADADPGVLRRSTAWLNANPFVSTLIGFFALVAAIVIAISTN